MAACVGGPGCGGLGVSRPRRRIQARRNDRALRHFVPIGADVASSLPIQRRHLRARSDQTDDPLDVPCLDPSSPWSAPALEPIFRSRSSARLQLAVCCLRRTLPCRVRGASPRRLHGRRHHNVCHRGDGRIRLRASAPPGNARSLDGHGCVRVERAAYCVERISAVSGRGVGRLDFCGGAPDSARREADPLDNSVCGGHRGCGVRRPSRDADRHYERSPALLRVVCRIPGVAGPPATAAWPGPQARARPRRRGGRGRRARAPPSCSLARSW